MLNKTCTWREQVCRGDVIRCCPLGEVTALGLWWWVQPDIWPQTPRLLWDICLANRMTTGLKLWCIDG